MTDKYELRHKTGDDTNPQTWSLFDIQNKLSGQIKEISGLKEQLKNHESTINAQQSTINHLQQNPIPINFIYIQLSRQPDPKNLWPIFEWKEVTSEYSGLFFRAEGSNSASFGRIQEDNAPRLTQVERVGEHCDNDDLITLNPNSWSKWVFSGGFGGSNLHRFFTSHGEVRPRNMAIRIWKRTG